MGLDFNIIFNQISEFYKSFADSKVFFGIKFFLAIYITVLILNVVILVVMRIGSDWRTAVKGMDIPTVSKKKSQKEWQKIEARLETGNFSQYKVAILDADRLVDNILSRVGYEGENLGERLEKINVVQLENLQELKNSHQISRRIVYEKDFFLDEKTAKETLNIYKKALESLDYI